MELTVTITPEDGLQGAMQKLADATQRVSEEYKANINIKHGEYLDFSEAYVEERHPATGQYFTRVCVVSREREA